MPELPEVETTVNYLKKKIKGKKILNCWTDWPKLIKRYKSFKKFCQLIQGKKILNVWRKGKNVLIDLDEDFILLIHQKISGHLLYGLWKKEGQGWKAISPKTLSDPYNRFLHLIFFLDNGKMLALSDLRKFGKVVLGKREEILQSDDLKKLAKDPFEITFEEFKEKLKKQKGQVKEVLMNQEKVVSGIGNIYSDEILWLAKINPKKRAYKLKDSEIEDIFKAMKKVLKKAIELEGDSISDYRKPDGTKGGYQKVQKVYQREGLPCPRCKTKIESFKLKGRTCRFCPQCQK